VFAPGLLEQLDDLLVRGLREVPVPETYGPEVRGGLEADELVHLGAEQLGGLGGAHGRGEGEAPGLQAAEAPDSGPGGHPGSEAVVHEDHGPPANLGLGTVAPEVAQPALHLRRLPLRDLLQVILGDAEPPDDLLVEDADAPGGDGADAELGLARRPQLARDEDVQRRVEGPRYLVPYGDPSAREGEDHGALVPVRGEPLCQPPAGVLPVPERWRSVEHPQKPPQRAASTLDHDPGHARRPVDVLSVRGGSRLEPHVPSVTEHLYHGVAKRL
jgi:hypothetical protein